MMERSGRSKFAFLGVLAIGVGIAAWRLPAPGPEGATGARRDIIVPPLSAPAQSGKKAYEDNCARCHGQNAGGTGMGPPFVHEYYDPRHHVDAAFLRAVSRGVRQHHWDFGGMPPQRHVSERQTRMIIRYVRELQEANGIHDERR